MVSSSPWKARPNRAALPSRFTNGNETIAGNAMFISACSITAPLRSAVGWHALRSTSGRATQPSQFLRACTSRSVFARVRAAGSAGLEGHCVGPAARTRGTVLFEPMGRFVVTTFMRSLRAGVGRATSGLRFDARRWRNITARCRVPGPPWPRVRRRRPGRRCAGRPNLDQPCRWRCG